MPNYAPQIVNLPEFFELSDGMQIVVTAVDQNTNATVSGVTISAVSLSVDLGTTVETLTPPSPVLGAYTSGAEAA